MLYEKKHPLHDAVMQGGHINHAYAVKRYQSLMRRAWDPAARSLPVKPMRDAANTDDREAASIQAPSSHAPFVPTGPATRVPGAPIAANAATRAVSKNPMADVASPSAPLQPQGNRSGKAGGTKIAQATPPYGSANAHSDARVQPPRPQEFNRRGEQAELIDARILSHYQLSIEAMEERTRYRNDALASLSLAERNLGMPETPPYGINERHFGEAALTVRARKDLSDLEQYAYLRLFGYEDTTEGSNDSRGGILIGTLNGLRALANELRSELGKPAITATLPSALTLDEIIDLQKVFLIRWLHADKILDRINSAPKPVNENELDELSPFDPLAMVGSNEMAAQIADTMFLHGIEGATPILQRAINNTIGLLGESDRARLSIAGPIGEDKRFGQQTRSMMETLASDPEAAAVFLIMLQVTRAEAMIDRTTTPAYEGFNIARVWGLKSASAH